MSTPSPKSGVEIAPGHSVPDSVLEFSYSSASGPGGQNVNKKLTKCTLKVRVDDLGLHPAALRRLEDGAGKMVNSLRELTIQADEHRSQIQNREETVARLREMLVRAMTIPKVRRKTKPSRGSKERRLESKKARSSIKAARRSMD